eukprot:CAMPEP_0206207606 /NCGR_PEP_ID=MMETSP0166-20121206/15694_1 /ASSEMBLY_ACC=CAM_ASM_000260 /TAXON_ID=95228 /ORGANISM="Vannella robusta, Strain DIVA3 518/3/11/1/6" /LENGTH=267 /DNA_ID=CAMNT_0053628405 /DNA_START=933 /DNA_END=1733 /DNA_ORIENTATION=-
MEVEGSVALITGGASGLGESTARALIAKGINLLIFDMNEDRCKDVCKELLSLHPSRKVVYHIGDVTNEDDVNAAFEKIAAIGALRVVVNCAGIGFAARTVSSKGVPMDLGIFKRLVDINLTGSFNVCRLGASHMVKHTPPSGPDNARGVIINTASVAAFDGQIGQVAYSATKGGIAGMTLPMARDLGPAGIRVLTIAPGIYNTPLVAMMPEDVRNGLAADVVGPRRLGNPPEFGQLVVHMVENPYLNGETIRLDGAIRMPPKSSPVK